MAYGRLESRDSYETQADVQTYSLSTHLHTVGVLLALKMFQGCEQRQTFLSQSDRHL